MFRIFRLLRSSIERNTKIECRRCDSRCVPAHEPAQQSDVSRLGSFLEDKSNVLVLTGAGVSTESGEFLHFVACDSERFNYLIQISKEYPTIAPKASAYTLAMVHVPSSIWNSCDRLKCANDIGHETLSHGHDSQSSNRMQRIWLWRGCNARNGSAPLSRRTSIGCTPKRTAMMCSNCTAAATMSFVWATDAISK